PTGGTIVLSMVAAFVLVWAVTAVRSRARAQLKS
ncbi:MAG: anchored repeat-type ABC transporter permease subunit, partial [Rothia mucilaginosa]|nr:anchored repeat-type ABC transporter permease subunit [Rothia mucilaginosa]